MPDTFAITIIFIAASTLIGAFIKGRSRDVCLKGFSKSPVTLEKKGGKVIWGRARVENTGLELVYSEPYLDEKDNHYESSYIMYKDEFEDIQAIVRYIDTLSEEEKKIRDKEFKKTHNPNIFRKLKRRIRNFFGTVRDSIMEVANLFIGKAKAMTPAGKMMEGQDKYVSKMQGSLISSVSTSFEPMLERYIGRRIVITVMKDGEKNEYSGILKDYSSEFIQIMDTNYKGHKDSSARLADLVVTRSTGLVRHAGE
jgi:small nuclear ribonucleoprotein (snRNP)-like protein